MTTLPKSIPELEDQETVIPPRLAPPPERKFQAAFERVNSRNSRGRVRKSWEGAGVGFDRRGGRHKRDAVDQGSRGIAFRHGFPEIHKASRLNRATYSSLYVQAPARVASGTSTSPTAVDKSINPVGKMPMAIFPSVGTRYANVHTTRPTQIAVPGPGP